MESNFEWITANGDIGIRFFHSIDDGGYSNPPHWHNDLEIIYLLEGRLKVRFGDGGERQIGADELLVINSGTIHAVTAYPNQAIVLQVPYEMLLQYMEHYDQLYFVVDERPASEAEKQKLAEFKAVLREMDEVYGAQKEGYQLKFDSLLLEALYRLQVDYAVRIGKEHIPQNQKAVQQIRDRICRDLQHPEARIMELLPKHGCENYKSVSRLFKERYGCGMKEMQKRYEKEKGDRPMGQWVRIRKAEMP